MDISFADFEMKTGDTNIKTEHFAPVIVNRIDRPDKSKTDYVLSLNEDLTAVVAISDETSRIYVENIINKQTGNKCRILDVHENDEIIKSCLKCMYSFGMREEKEYAGRMLDIYEKLYNQLKENDFCDCSIQINDVSFKLCPCDYDPDRKIGSMDDIAYFLIMENENLNSSESVWSVVNDICFYEKRQLERQADKNALMKFYEENIKDKTQINDDTLSFYSDWHKDIYGFRPHKGAEIGEYRNPNDDNVYYSICGDKGKIKEFIEEMEYILDEKLEITLQTEEKTNISIPKYATASFELVLKSEYENSIWEYGQEAENEEEIER